MPKIGQSLCLLINEARSCEGLQDFQRWVFEEMWQSTPITNVELWVSELVDDSYFKQFIFKLAIKMKHIYNIVGVLILVSAAATMGLSCWVYCLMHGNKKLKKLKFLTIMIFLHELAVLVRGLMWVDNFRWIG